MIIFFQLLFVLIYKCYYILEIDKKNMGNNKTILFVPYVKGKITQVQLASVSLLPLWADMFGSETSSTFCVGVWAKLF